MELVSYTALLDFNFYTLLCGNSALKQKSVHLSVACHVHVLLQNAVNKCLRLSFDN
jgi:hypothetical protein